MFCKAALWPSLLKSYTNICVCGSLGKSVGCHCRLNVAKSQNGASSPLLYENKYVSPKCRNVFINLLWLSFAYAPTRVHECAHNICLDPIVSDLVLHYTARVVLSSDYCSHCTTWSRHDGEKKKFPSQKCPQCTIHRYSWMLKVNCYWCHSPPQSENDRAQFAQFYAMKL